MLQGVWQDAKPVYFPLPQKLLLLISPDFSRLHELLKIIDTDTKDLAKLDAPCTRCYPAITVHTVHETHNVVFSSSQWRGRQLWQ